MSRIFRGRAGFTLIEMMTVIAIIMILAAILLPVMSRVQEQSRRTECMSNLHQIAVAIKLYKLDERGYPKDLSERAIPAGQRWFGPDADANNVPDKTAPGYGLATLYPDYIESIKTFSCPDDEADSLDNSMLNGGGDGNPKPDKPNESYDAYDGFDPYFGELKYKRYWLNDDTSTSYQRQLCWRYPPEDSVVTWCSYHRRASQPMDPDAATAATSDKDVILYLDGTTRIAPTESQVKEQGSGHYSLPGSNEE